MMKISFVNSLLCATLVALSGGCQAKSRKEQPHSPSAKSQALQPTAQPQGLQTPVTEFSSLLFLSPQPAKADIPALRSTKGITAIVSLQTAEEIKTMTWNPAREAKTHGLIYQNTPWNLKKGIQIENYQATEKLVQMHLKKGRKVLVHCRSGQRALGWLALHLKSEGFSQDEALNKARELGLKNPRLIEALMPLFPEVKGPNKNSGQ